MEEQMMWDQYSRDGRQGHMNLRQNQNQPYSYTPQYWLCTIEGDLLELWQLYFLSTNQFGLIDLLMALFFLQTHLFTNGFFICKLWCNFKRKTYICFDITIISNLSSTNSNAWHHSFCLICLQKQRIIIDKDSQISCLRSYLVNSTLEDHNRCSFLQNSKHGCFITGSSSISGGSWPNIILQLRSLKSVKLNTNVN